MWWIYSVCVCVCGSDLVGRSYCCVHQEVATIFTIINYLTNFVNNYYKYDKYYVHNVFTSNYEQLVGIDYNFNLPLK